MKFTIGNLDARKAAAISVTLITLGFWLVIATYPKAYLFNPLDTKLVVFRFEQIFSSLGWVLYSFVPVLLAWFTKANGKSTRIIYIISASLWPVAILVIQITLVFHGSGFYSYLGKHPIFALNDILAPLFLLAIQSTLFPTNEAKLAKKQSSR